MKTYVRPSIKGDADLLASRLRRADLDEIEASGHYLPVEALEIGRQASLQPLTAIGDGKPIAMFGAVRETPDIGRIWLLGSDDIFSVRFRFLRESKSWFKHVSSPFKVVTNVVDMRNTKHISWLRWLGVKFCNIETRGPKGLPFIEFYWRSN